MNCTAMIVSVSMRRVLVLTAACFLACCSGLLAQQDAAVDGVFVDLAADSTAVLRPHIELYCGATIGSNAMPPWVLMGLLFGGDVTAPLAVTVERTDARGAAFWGGRAEAGLLLAWQERGDLGRPVALRAGLTSRAWWDARWSPGAAHFLWGPLGGADPQNQLRSLEGTQARGLVTTAFTLEYKTEHLKLTGRVGEATRGVDGQLNQGAFLVDSAHVEVAIEGQLIRTLSPGLMVGLDVEYRNEHVRVGVRNLGAYAFPRAAHSRMDTSVSTLGWPLITQVFDGAEWTHTDTVVTGVEPGAVALSGLLPATLYVHAHAERWSASALWNAWAPRPELMVSRSFISTERLAYSAGLAWGGWGGLSVPAGLTYTGNQGGKLALKTRIAPWRDVGMRSTIFVSWTRPFYSY